MNGQTEQLQKMISRLQAGDSSARNELINCACERLQRLTRKMLKSHPAVHRWEQTDDVFQNAMIRLCRALMEVTPQSVRHFFNLAAQQIRRELIDLGRHYFGPEGLGAHHDTEKKASQNADSSREDFRTPESNTHDPRQLAEWTEFHTQVETLPDEEREIFNLLWYQEVSQTEAAALLDIPVRTLQRRWQSARLKLHEGLKGKMPE